MTRIDVAQVFGFWGGMALLVWVDRRIALGVLLLTLAVLAAISKHFERKMTIEIVNYEDELRKAGLLHICTSPYVIIIRG